MSFCSVFSLLVLTLQVHETFSSESQPKVMAGYQPMSSMALSNIDLDHAEMGAHLGKHTDTSFDNAKQLYEEGANTKPYAMLSLDTPLQHPLANGINLAGLTPDGSNVLGTVFGNYPEGSTDIGFLYDGSAGDCAVGASWNPKLMGCLIPNGELVVEGFNDRLWYTYNPSKDNQNRLSLQKLSTKAKQKMYECEHCPFDMYTRYVDYYGNYSYADAWVQSAFEGSKTDFDRGDANFKHYDYSGRAVVIKVGTVLLHIWMSVQSELDDAIASCQEACDHGNTCNDEAIHSWDLAVGWYTGSLEGKNFLGSGSGRLLHKVADKRCSAFNTCDSITGLSNVNDEMFQLFHAGQKQIRLSQCSKAEVVKDRVSKLMIVPLIQEVLWHAHISDYKPKQVLDQPDAAEIISAGAATSAAAILPLVHFCDQSAAVTVYENLKTGHDADFVKVKKALESTYDCLGVTCFDVGGLYNSKEAYYLEGAEPCGGYDESQAHIAESKSSGDKLSDFDLCLIVCGTIIGCIVLFGITYKLSGHVGRAEMVVKPPQEGVFRDIDIVDEDQQTVDDFELPADRGEIA